MLPIDVIQYIQLDTIDSTNNWAKKHPAPPQHLLCITAEEQTAGRGQHARSWVSPRGVNLYASFCFCIPRHCPLLPELGLLLAQSLTAILKKRGFSPQIKWPNDILISNKKIAGILSEAVTGKEEIQVVLGIGINVNMSAADCLAIDQPATSLQLEALDKAPLSREALLHELLEQFLQDLNQTLASWESR